MPQGIPVPPRSAIEILPDWLEMMVYNVPLDSINFDTSTGEIILEFLPDGIVLQSIDYKLVTPFTAASDDVFPEIWFGDTDEHKRFGVLNSQQLTDTEFYGSGSLPIFFDSTSTGETSLTAYVHWASGQAPTAGELELRLTYRANSGRLAKRGKRAK